MGLLQPCKHRWKRNPHQLGSTAYHASVAHLPSGPATLVACGLWPFDLNRILFLGDDTQSQCRRQRFAALFQHGPNYLDTDYSGAGGIEQMFDMSLQAAVELGILGRSNLTHYSASDVDDVCLRVLKARGVQHVFHDLSSKLHPRANQAIQELRPPKSKENKKEHAEVLTAAYDAMDSYLSRRRRICYPSDHLAPCLVHNKPCPVNPPMEEHGIDDDGAGPWRANISGVACQPWTRFGSGLGLAHSMTEYFHKWTHNRAANSEDFVGMENSDRCPPSPVQQKLRTSHRMIALVFGSEQLGWPVRRRRLLLFFLNDSKWVWCGPEQASLPAEFERLFGRSIVMTADDCFGDSALNHAEVKSALGRKRGRYFHEDQDPSKVDIRKLLNPSSVKIHGKYAKLYSEGARVGPGGCFIADLEQDPDHRPRCGPVLMAQVRHGVIYSFSRDEVFTPLELQAAHGWPSFAGGDKFKSPLMFSSLRLQDQQSLQGNGMHLAAMGAFSM